MANRSDLCPKGKALQPEDSERIRLLLSEGLTKEETAARLNISVNTLYNHMKDNPDLREAVEQGITAGAGSWLNEARKHIQGDPDCKIKEIKLFEWYMTMTYGMSIKQVQDGKPSHVFNINNMQVNNNNVTELTKDQLDNEIKKLAGGYLEQLSRDDSSRKTTFDCLDDGAEET